MVWWWWIAPAVVGLIGVILLIRGLMALAPAEATVLRPCLDCEGHLGQLLPASGRYAAAA